MQRYRVLGVPIKLYYEAYGRCEKKPLFNNGQYIMLL